MLWVFIFFVWRVLHVNEKVKGTCMFWKLQLLNMKWCVNHHWRISEQTEVLQLPRWCLLRVHDTFQGVFFIVHGNVWVHDVFFRIKLWSDPKFDQNWDSLKLPEIQTQAPHKRWLRFQIIRLLFTFFVTLLLKMLDFKTNYKLFVYFNLLC